MESRVRGMGVVWMVAVAGLIGSTTAGPLQGQLAERVRSVGDGAVRFEFETRPDVEVCEHGIRWGDGHTRWRWEGGGEPETCVRGRIAVELRLRDGRVTDVDVLRPGAGRRGAARDLGAVEAGAASRYLLSLAFEGATASAAEDALMPGVVAARPTPAWPELLEIARDASLSKGVRKGALFWVGQEAADAVVRELSDVAQGDDEDQDIRNAAVFALSQREDHEAVPVLMELARTAEQAETRKTAMFWLAQSDDPRVVRFFEDVLLGRAR